MFVCGQRHEGIDLKEYDQSRLVELIISPTCINVYPLVQKIKQLVKWQNTTLLGMFYLKKVRKITATARRTYCFLTEAYERSNAFYSQLCRWQGDY